MKRFDELCEGGGGRLKPEGVLRPLLVVSPAAVNDDDRFEFRAGLGDCPRFMLPKELMGGEDMGCDEDGGAAQGLALAGCMGCENWVEDGVRLLY